MAHLKPVEIFARASEFSECADHAVQNSHFNVGAICSYAALFWATRAALAYEGFDRQTWAHSELRSKFTNELINNRNRYPHNFNDWLADAFALRNSAQYGLQPPKAKRVRRMVKHVKEFTQRVKEVIEK